MEKLFDGVTSGWKSWVGSKVGLLWKLLGREPQLRATKEMSESLNSELKVVIKIIRA